MAPIENPYVEVEGVYTADINDLQIRTKREATAPSLGAFKKDDMFPVFEVYPEDLQGIVWARISSNTNGAPSKFIGLRVFKNIKAHLVKKFANENDSANDLVKAINANTDALLLNAAMLRKIAEK